MSPEQPKRPLRPKKAAAPSNVVALRPAPEAPQKKKRPARPARPLPPVATADGEAALTEMVRHLTGNAGPLEALRAQLQTVHALLQPKACYVARFEPERRLLHVEHVRGRYDERITAVSPDEGVLGRAFTEGRIQQEEDVLAIPLQGAHGVNGCLALLGARKSASDSLLLALAGQLSAAYELARLRDDSARREKDLQTAIAGLKSLEDNRDELLGNVSHDLKNPLTTIKAYLAMLGRSKLGTLTEAQQKAVQTCDRSADRMLRMVNDLLLMSRLQSGKMQLNQRPFGLKAVADEVVRALAPQAEAARVRLTLPPCAEVFVRGDRERIAEAIAHLVEHAMHHCEAEGSVEVRVAAEGGLALLRVRDDGPGISAEDLEHLFDPFFRTQPGTPRVHGGGLALPLVAKILGLHGGRVEASSTLGEGSCLQLALPMFAGAVASPQPEVPAPTAGGILIVEDDRDCREVLQQVLEEEGYRVMTAAGGDAARAILAHIRPAMVLLDLRLSEEDGRSVLRFIRGDANLADVAVYLISGASEVSSLASAGGLERIDGFFEKPLRLAKLLDTVAAVVRPSRRSAPLA